MKVEPASNVSSQCLCSRDAVAVGVVLTAQCCSLFRQITASATQFHGAASDDTPTPGRPLGEELEPQSARAILVKRLLTSLERICKHMVALTAFCNQPFLTATAS